MGNPRKVSNRPKKRTLVRWDDNLNELLLLTVQSVCNQQGVKIPWAIVADTMGNNVTEGAIVQHLAKMRTRRVAADKDVPPPLRRGGSGSIATTRPSAGTGNMPKVVAKAAAGPSTIKDSAKNKGKKPANSADDDEEQGSQGGWEESSDEEYGKKRRARTRKGSQRKKVKAKADEAVIKLEDTEAETDIEVNDQESADDRSDDLLGVGAQFLDFPNDGKLSSRSPRSTEGGDAESKLSKVVVLNLNRRRPGFERLVRRLNAQGTPPMNHSQALVLSSSYDNDHYQIPNMGITQGQDDLILGLGIQGFTDQPQRGLPGGSAYVNMFSNNPYQHGHHAQSFPSTRNDYRDPHSIGSFVHTQHDPMSLLPYPNAFMASYADFPSSTGYSVPLDQSALFSPDEPVDPESSFNDKDESKDHQYSLVDQSSSSSGIGDSVNLPASSNTDLLKQDDTMEDQEDQDLQPFHGNMMNQFIDYPWMGTPDGDH